ncbi:MAG: hypothetical protein ACRERV_14705, partial [Methylococcales bacterium]
CKSSPLSAFHPVCAIQLRISARRKYELYMARILLIGELADSGLMQRTHPDKCGGYEDEFRKLQAALNYVRSKIDLLRTPEQMLGGFE